MSQQWIEDVEPRLKAIELMCAGARVSVWACRGEVLELVTGRTTIDESALVDRIWMECRVELQEWRTVVEKDMTVVPLECRLRLTGLLVVAGQLPVDDIDRPYIDKVAQRLAALLSFDPASARLPLTVKIAATEMARVASGRRLTRENLIRLLALCSGRKTTLAGWLGVSRQTVHNWCRYYGIRKPGTPDEPTSEGA